MIVNNKRIRFHFNVKKNNKLYRKKILQIK